MGNFTNIKVIPKFLENFDFSNKTTNCSIEIFLKILYFNGYIAKFVKVKVVDKSFENFNCSDKTANCY